VAFGNTLPRASVAAQVSLIVSQAGGLVWPVFPSALRIPSGRHKPLSTVKHVTNAASDRILARYRLIIVGTL
jgi:hypothetical protein